jgi:hypothetical protein
VFLAIHKEEPIMTRADPPSRPDPSVSEPAEDEPDEALAEGEEEQEDQEEVEDDEELETDELSEETGIDLTDASDLDADNVPNDEEFDRVIQAPD